MPRPRRARRSASEAAAGSATPGGCRRAGAARRRLARDPGGRPPRGRRRSPADCARRLDQYGHERPRHLPVAEYSTDSARGSALSGWRTSSTTPTIGERRAVTDQREPVSDRILAGPVASGERRADDAHPRRVGPVAIVDGATASNPDPEHLERAGLRGAGQRRQRIAQRRPPLDREPDVAVDPGRRDVARRRGAADLRAAGHAVEQPFEESRLATPRRGIALRPARRPRRPADTRAGPASSATSGTRPAARRGRYEHQSTARPAPDRAPRPPIGQWPGAAGTRSPLAGAYPGRQSVVVDRDGDQERSMPSTTREIDGRLEVVLQRRRRADGAEQSHERTGQEQPPARPAPAQVSVSTSNCRTTRPVEARGRGAGQFLDAAGAARPSAARPC